LYQQFSRVEYVLVYFSRLPVVLPLAMICSLVHIRYTVGGYSSQTIELARQNAMTLQYFLCGSPGDNKPRSVSVGVVPFPSLRHLCLFGHNPFDDDTLFWGKAATLETLDMQLDSKTFSMLRRLVVFTPVSHPRLKFVKPNFCGDLPGDQYDSAVDSLQLALRVGLNMVVLYMDGLEMPIYY
ncbi:hypothetical protein GGI16_006618, partial [Coemansia sp. S142-1]